MQAPRCIAFALLLLAASVATVAAQTPTLTLPRPSQHATVSQTIGTTDLSLNYHRPGVKGRAIWGELVPFDKTWRTGANETTKFIASTDVQIEGQRLPAGTYALHTVPGRDAWTVMFSPFQDTLAWNEYALDQARLRVSVTPQSAEPTEWMQFTFEDLSADAGTLALRWEKLRVPVRITVDVNGRVLATAREAVAAAKPTDWETPYRAANWGFGANVAADDVAAWSRRALEVKENMATLALAAKLRAREGRPQEATTQMSRAIALGKADKDVAAEQVAANEKLLAEWTAAAGTKSKR